MKLLISVLILILSFQSLSKANDIREFEIEGMSIGDSLLNHMSVNEIKNNTLKYFNDERKYYVVGNTYNLKTYEQVEIYLKTGDKNYIIRTLGGFINMEQDECLLMKKEIDKEFREIFSNLNIYSATRSHDWDKTGKSKQIQTNYVFGKSAAKENHIRSECVVWSEEIKKKDGFINNLLVIAMTEEILQWIDSGYK
tara:strand:- start:735 stop:1322 length:588 start_codon:yes stop_codon:yes gene_type:complete